MCIRSSGRCAYWISTTVMPAPPETDVFVAVVGYAADGVEILADNGAQGAGAGAVEDAYAVLLKEDGVVNKIVDGGEGFFGAHTAHVEFGAEVEFLFIDGVARLLTDEGRDLRGGRFSRPGGR